VIPRILIGAAKIPNSEDELRLFQRGGEFSITLGGNELMNNRLSGSEQALATLAHEKIASRTNARILIGGLGMGFTLRAALAAFGLDAKIIVSELVPEVVLWAHGPMTEIFGDCLDDERVAIKTIDVFDLIDEARQEYDAILLDVDNGPDGITHASNDRLYDEAGLQTAYAALRSGGVLAIWSSTPDRQFTQRLHQSGFEVEEKAVRARASGKGARHVIWLAVKP